MIGDFLLSFSFEYSWYSKHKIPGNGDAGPLLTLPRLSLGRRGQPAVLQAAASSPQNYCCYFKSFLAEYPFLSKEYFVFALTYNIRII